MRTRTAAWERALGPWMGCKSEHETQEPCLQEIVSPGSESVSWCGLGFKTQRFLELCLWGSREIPYHLGRMRGSENTCLGGLKIKGRRTYKMAMFSYHKVVSNKLGRGPRIGDIARTQPLVPMVVMAHPRSQSPGGHTESGGTCGDRAAEPGALGGQRGQS